MTGKEITDAGMEYAFAAGRLAEKLERYNTEVEAFLAKYDKQDATVGKREAEVKDAVRADEHTKLRKVRRNIRPVICTQIET